MTLSLKAANWFVMTLSLKSADRFVMSLSLKAADWFVMTLSLKAADWFVMTLSLKAANWSVMTLSLKTANWFVMILTTKDRKQVCYDFVQQSLQTCKLIGYKLSLSMCMSHNHFYICVTMLSVYTLYWTSLWLSHRWRCYLLILHIYHILKMAVLSRWSGRFVALTYHTWRGLVPPVFSQMIGMCPVFLASEKVDKLPFDKIIWLRSGC